MFVVRANASNGIYINFFSPSSHRSYKSLRNFEYDNNNAGPHNDAIKWIKKKKNELHTNKRIKKKWWNSACVGNDFIFLCCNRTTKKSNKFNVLFEMQIWMHTSSHIISWHHTIENWTQCIENIRNRITDEAINNYFILDTIRISALRN